MQLFDYTIYCDSWVRQAYKRPSANFSNNQSSFSVHPSGFSLSLRRHNITLAPLIEYLRKKFACALFAFSRARLRRMPILTSGLWPRFRLSGWLSFPSSLLFTSTMRFQGTANESQPNRVPRGKQRKINHERSETWCTRKCDFEICPLNHEFPHRGDFAARWMTARRYNPRDVGRTGLLHWWMNLPKSKIILSQHPPFICWYFDRIYFVSTARILLSCSRDSSIKM